MLAQENRFVNSNQYGRQDSNAKNRPPRLGEAGPVYSALYYILIETLNELRGMFLSGEEEDAGGLSPVKDDEEAWRKQTRKAFMFFIKD